jgi:type IV pilus assembly protein PilE
MARTHSCGFTLIELLVVVVLVGILAAVAVPSYSAYVVRGQRAAAKVALEQAAQYLERNYTANGCYNYPTQAQCTTPAGTQVSLPVQWAPTDGGPATYAITISAMDGQSFTLNATPCGDGSACTAPGSNTTFTDPDCDVLSLDNAGTKVATGRLGSVTCWQR